MHVVNSLTGCTDARCRHHALRSHMCLRHPSGHATVDTSRLEKNVTYFGGNGDWNAWPVFRGLEWRLGARNDLKNGRYLRVALTRIIVKLHLRDERTDGRTKRRVFSSVRPFVCLFVSLSVVSVRGVHHMEERSAKFHTKFEGVGRDKNPGSTKEYT